MNDEFQKKIFKNQNDMDIINSHLNDDYFLVNFESFIFCLLTLTVT
jgi:hypothetical protein